jgi:Rhodopirellula transposase DDE domain/Insertion element 4 transposase N-terminal/Transposase DDE domain
MMLGMHPWIGLSDDVRLGLLTEWVTAELVDEVLAECGTRDQRPGALPARFMVYYVLALALFQQDSYDDVAENLVGALEGMDEAIPNKSSFTRARQRLGAGVIEAVFRRLAGPVAPAGLEGAFWRGMRVAAVDGFLLDVPDTEVNRAAFGGPVAGRGQPAGFPQARVVTLTETGTHSSIDASVGGFAGGEPELAIAMAGSAAGMLVIMDRGFAGVALWKAYRQAGSHLLIRARSSVARRPVTVLDDGTYLARMNLAGQKGAHPGGVVVRVIEYRVDGGEVIRLLTDLADPAAFPAAELAALYQERWESEGSFRQVKTFQRGPQEILRSADPELVRQEIWAHLAVHHCLTRIIMRLAAGERIDPDRISFIKVLKHVRRSVIRQSAQTSVQIKQLMVTMAAKVRRKLDNGIRRLREADRALKRPASKYSFRKAGQIRRPTRRVAAKVLTLHPAIVQLLKQRHWPGTSKWNRIEHRLFCQISLAWRARPLTSYDVIIDTIGRVTTKTGLTAIAVLDENAYPTGTEIGDEQMRDIEERCLRRSEWHGEWNYTLLAHPAAPGPAPQTAPPDQARQEALNHPALTGLQPGDVKALAAALEVPFDADREQKYHLRRGRRRVNVIRRAGPHGNLRTDVTGHVLILRLRDHLCLTAKAAAVLFGIHPTSVSHAVTLTRRLIGENAIPVPAAAGPPPEPIRTIDDLRKYAGQHGIEIFVPPAQDDSPPEATLTASGTRQTLLILKCCHSDRNCPRS